jgi:hypothetical protein
MSSTKYKKILQHWFTLVFKLSSVDNFIWRRHYMWALTNVKIAGITISTFQCYDCLNFSLDPRSQCCRIGKLIHSEEQRNAGMNRSDNYLIFGRVLRIGFSWNSLPPAQVALQDVAIQSYTKLNNYIAGCLMVTI